MVCWFDICWNECVGYQVYTDACRRTDIIIAVTFFVLLILGFWWMNNNFSTKWLRVKQSDFIEGGMSDDEN